MKEIMQLAHDFLQYFCLDNKQNQQLLHQHLDIFLTPGVSSINSEMILICNFINYFFQILEAQTMCAIFKDNSVLCSKIKNRVIQHFLHLIETHGKHVQYLKFLLTIVKAEGQYMRNCQNMVMNELILAGEDVVMFYTDKASFNAFIEMMRQEKDSLDESGPIQYHIYLIKLLAACTGGKNEETERKCHQLLSFDDIIKMVIHPETIPQVKQAYIDFVIHCFIDTEIDIKDIYSDNHIWTIFENFVIDIDAMVDNLQNTSGQTDKPLLNYILSSALNLITTCFDIRFSEHSTTVQAHQPTFRKILQSMLRLRNCPGLNDIQRNVIQKCAESLYEVAKKRSLALTQDLQDQVSKIRSNSTMAFRKSKESAKLSALGLKSSNSSFNGNISNSNQSNDRNVIEGLQDIVSFLENQLKPLVKAEQSVLVDVLYRPELLFASGTVIRKKCSNGEFISQLIHQTQHLIEAKKDEGDKDEKKDKKDKKDRDETLCIKILKTLKEMMVVDQEFDEKVN
jgi:hypothetical protein